MKIIESGKDTFRGTCKKCGCYFEYTLDDLNTAYPCHIKCPYCKEDFHHPVQIRLSFENYDKLFNSNSINSTDSIK